jgi:nucleoside 2-deoxyribosyltransferase
MDQCFICQNPSVNNSDLNPPDLTIDCPCCGKFRVLERAIVKYWHKNILDRHICSGALREHHEKGTIYSIEDLDLLKYSVSVPENPIEQIDKLLLYVASKSDSSDKVTTFNESDYSLAYAKHPHELSFLMRMAREIGYFDPSASEARSARLSIPTGWNRVSELRKNEVDSKIAFVAMSFHKSTNDIWEFGIKPALEFTGYQPLRIDQTETNNKIDDEIIAGIRKSGFMVADFTNHRPNVYYEAGFAMGLGRTVIRTCREDQEKDLHFDTRQFSHILWSNPDDLKKKLINRIEATIPKPKN